MMTKLLPKSIEYVFIFQGLNGGTTVSGTMVLAHMADIPIFVTGGIGGVHRGAENSRCWSIIQSDKSDLFRN